MRLKARTSWRNVCSCRKRESWGVGLDVRFPSLETVHRKVLWLFHVKPGLALVWGKETSSVFRLVRGRREMAEFCKLNSSRPHVAWCMTFWFPQLWLTMWITLGKARNECWARNLAI